jgi:hypothetical protein
MDQNNNNKKYIRLMGELVKPMNQVIRASTSNL